MVKIYKISANDTDNAVICECMILAETEDEAWKLFEMNQDNDSEDLSQEMKEGWYDIEEIVDMKPRILFSYINIF